MLDASDLPDSLAARLALPLPGEAAQARFEPQLSVGRHRGPVPPAARGAAVIILLYREEDRWKIPLTLRPAHLDDHAGQVSFLGGRRIPEETTEAAAVRELEEELGVPRSDVRVLGRLTDLYVFGSNFLVTPWVGVVQHRPVWQPCSEEVAEVLAVPLGQLVDSAYYATHLHSHGPLQFSAPHFHLANHIVWGATSMMLAELVAVLEEHKEDRSVPRQ